MHRQGRAGTICPIYLASKEGPPLVARGDIGLVRRGDMDPDAVAHDIAPEYYERLIEPMSLRGWAATANRCRLIDLARKKRPVTVDHDAFFRQMTRFRRT